MGADPRSTVGTATDANANANAMLRILFNANAMLRILFSRLGQPHIGSPTAFAFNVPSVRASGAITIERGAGKTVRQTFTRTGGMCPRCEGRGTVSDIDLTQLFDDSKSLPRARSPSPATRWTAGGQWGSSPNRASSTRTSRSAGTPRRSCTTSSTASRPR
jgi:hypothetical protein